MVALPEFDGWTEAQYLEYERNSDTRNEFSDGRVYAMAGASERHNQIASALNYLLYGQMLDHDCQVFQSDMRVKAESAYFYPDIVAVCGNADYLDNTHDTLLNPSVVIEILSPSTEDYDRGRKFKYYRAIPTLTDYLLIAQTKMHIEHFTRQADERWLLTDYTQSQQVIALPAINCTLALSDTYRKVTFGD